MFGWLVAGALAMSCATAAAADDAAAILRASADAYAALKSYQDVGVVETGSGGDIMFDTAFVRPEQFRFAWKQGHPFILLRFETITSVLRASGPRVTTWRKTYGDDATERIDASLANGVAGATGVSRGSAHTIATLLMPHLWDAEAFGSSVLALSNARVGADETVDRIPCKHLTGMTPKGNPMELWIGVADHLVRRVDTTIAEFHFSEFRRDVRIDGAIPAATFALDDVRH